MCHGCVEKAQGVSEFMEAITNAITHETEEQGLGVCPRHAVQAIQATIGEANVDLTDEPAVNAYLQGVTDMYNLAMVAATPSFQRVHNHERKLKKNRAFGAAYGTHGTVESAFEEIADNLQHVEPVKTPFPEKAPMPERLQQMFTPTEVTITAVIMLLLLSCM